MHLTQESCPSCDAYFGTHIFGFRSNPGPPLFVCGSCHEPFASKCREWRDTPFRGKLRYAILSLIYMAGLGLMSGLLISFGVGFFQFGMRNSRPTDSGIVVILAILAGAGFALAAQIVRVVWSVKRSRLALRAIKVSFWSIHTNLQALSLASLAAFLLCSWLIAKCVHPG